MNREKQIKILSIALALTIAIVSTIMILGIQLNFKFNNTGAKITAPIIVVGLIAILFLFKFIKKQNKTSFLIKNMEMKNNGKHPISPYFSIGFTYFDYMLYCGILSGLCGIISGFLYGMYNTLRFVTLTTWGYTLSRMAIVFAIYVLCLLIVTLGNMIAYGYKNKEVKEQIDEN